MENSLPSQSIVSDTPHSRRQTQTQAQIPRHQPSSRVFYLLVLVLLLQRLGRWNERDKVLVGQEMGERVELEGFEGVRRGDLG